MAQSMAVAQPIINEADVVVTTWSGLNDALSSAESGTVVHVDADIELQGTITIPADVTLAGDRSIHGSSGPRLWTDVSSFTGIRMEVGSRVSGIHLDGHLTTWKSYTEGDNYAGIEVNGPDVTIENCEIEGFEYAGVNDNGYSAYITHCSIHTMTEMGLGYGVVVQGDGGHPIIERCFLDNNRHSIAAAEGSGGFTLRDSRIGPLALDHAIDHHGPNGSELIVENCTIEPTQHTERGGFDHGGDPTEAIRIREHGGGGQASSIIIKNNWFSHSEEPAPPGDRYQAIWIDTPNPGDTWESVNATVEGNHYGQSLPPNGAGAPDNYIGSFINGEPAPEQTPSQTQESGIQPAVMFGLVAVGVGIALSRRKDNR